VTIDPAFEAFLARVYVDPEFREAFLRDPATEAMRAGLTGEQAASLAAIDREGLRLAAIGFAKKRKNKASPGGH
jgi:hypothetical protein